MPVLEREELSTLSLGFFRGGGLGSKSISSLRIFFSEFKSSEYFLNKEDSA